MREIPLTRGMVALVDDEDYERIARYTWQASKNSKGRRWYAMRSDGVAMHREVMGLERGDKRQVDHREPAETLNNQKYNLRVAELFQNQANRGRNGNNTSGYKGVSWNRTKSVWQATIGVGGKNLYLGRFSTPEEAHAAYCIAAAKHHGEFARTA